jgi:hypothetical protein
LPLRFTEVAEIAGEQHAPEILLGRADHRDALRLEQAGQTMLRRFRPCLRL